MRRHVPDNNGIVNGRRCPSELIEKLVNQRIEPRPQHDRALTVSDSGVDCCSVVVVVD